MAGGGIDTRPGKAYPGRLTFRVLVTSIIAASGGLIFGYDLGISGGVTSMDSFLKEFFPKVYLKESRVKPSDDQYCKFNSQTLTMFTSSLYLSALFASMIASVATRAWGRRTTMFFAGLLFFSGAVINGAAMNVIMLIVGRLLLGCGIGCANQAVITAGIAWKFGLSGNPGTLPMWYAGGLSHWYWGKFVREDVVVETARDLTRNESTATKPKNIIV
ncbi:hypothetical protein SAY86_019611 [Trapa natans]|uniref:Major facilitator superfamily (MFS) profile domain-containing protein n=1 Tax=Trapa natans TaxID=22666 RepID=A0AAN7LKU2_TRANT|nr:hypothetical protein SAY86_019611 [Trapa natans]